MKRSILIISLSAVLLLSGFILVVAQEQPKPQKDTVNMDTDAKPSFYYNVEDEKSGSKGSGKSSTIAIIAGAVVVVAGAAFFLLKKKK
ncbi:MAG: LPXTG cell wall anchor domain-containing protein [Bacteroidales bacterium]